MPIGCSGRHVPPCEIVILMTGAASHTGDALPEGTTPHIHFVRVAIISLSREISAGVTIHAAGMMQDSDYGLKGGSGGRIVTGSRSVNVPHSRGFLTSGESSNHQIGRQATYDNRSSQER